MNLNAKYDVFVSYSRKDYVDELKKPVAGSAVAALLDFLDKNGITYWFDKDGIYSGSEFVEVITDAITDSKMMIFVSSEHSNASPWTMGEIFEALEQEKHIVPFKIDNSPYNKKYRMMVRPLDYIEYFANPDVAFDSLLKAINVCKEEYAQAVAEEEKRKAEENAKQRRAAILEEIKTESLEFHRHASTLAQDAQRLVEKQKLVGNKDKKCPVCSTMQPIETPFCKKCGWTFNPIFDAHPKGDKDHLFVMRSLWNAVHDTDTIRINLENKMQELEALRKEKDTLAAMVQRLQQQLEAAKADAQLLSAQSKATEVDLRDKMIEITQQLTEANKSLLVKEKEIVSLQQQLDAELTSLKSKLRKVTKELEEYKSQHIGLQRRYDDSIKKRKNIELELNSEKNKRVNAEEHIKTIIRQQEELSKKHKDDEDDLWKELEKVNTELEEYKRREAERENCSGNTTILTGNTFLQEGIILNNRYKIIQHVAQGGFGIIYKAFDTKERIEVAIKEYYLKDYCRRNKNVVVSTGQIYNRYKQQFAREASLIASLNHHNIIKVFDVFDQNNTSYYAMEFVHGNSLDNVYGSFSQIETIDILIKIAETLQYMHSHNIVHGDIAPKNIFIDNKDIKIIDFGMGRHIGVDATTVTPTSPIGFTPSYSSPECYFNGERNKGNDVYSLGAIAFFLISGQRPPVIKELLDNEILLNNVMVKFNVLPKLMIAVVNAMAWNPSNRISLDDFLTELNNIHDLYKIGEITEEVLFNKTIVTKVRCPNCNSLLSIKTPRLKDILINCPQCNYRNDISKFNTL